MSKSNIKQFLIWFRNGFSFVTAWLLILLLIRNYVLGVEAVSTDFLIKMIISIAGGTLLFCIMFLPAVIKKWKFHTRLTIFIIAIGVYECVVFYWLGIFSGAGTILQYGIFIGMILICYLVCMAIYYGHYKKQGELYTEALKKYQQN